MAHKHHHFLKDLIKLFHRGAILRDVANEARLMSLQRRDTFIRRIT